MTNLVARIITEPRPMRDADPLFERHPAPSLLFARDGVIAQANAALQRLLRAQPASCRSAGAALAEFFPELRHQLAGLARAASACRASPCAAPDGSTFIARVQVVAVGTWPGLSLLLVSSRTSRSSRRELDAANKEFESLTSAAGHDLRGPLRILKGFTEALDDECGEVLNEEGADFSQGDPQGQRSHGGSDRRPADVLARQPRGDVAARTSTSATLVELVYYDLRHAQPGARRSTATCSPASTAWGDVRLMMTMLRTLLGNAWKFTGAQRRAATFAVYTEQRDGRDLDLRDATTAPDST